MILVSAYVRIKRFSSSSFFFSFFFFLMNLVCEHQNIVCDNREFKHWQRQRKRPNLKPLFDWMDKENNRTARATRT